MVHDNDKNWLVCILPVRQDAPYVQINKIKSKH
jgi:hypothetical protein